MGGPSERTFARRCIMLVLEIALCVMAVYGLYTLWIDFKRLKNKNGKDDK